MSSTTTLPTPPLQATTRKQLLLLTKQWARENKVKYTVGLFTGTVGSHRSAAWRFLWAGGQEFTQYVSPAPAAPAPSTRVNMSALLAKHGFSRKKDPAGGFHWVHSAGHLTAKYFAGCNEWELRGTRGRVTVLVPCVGENPEASITYQLSTPV